MRVLILEPKGTIWEGIAEQVTLPAKEGQMCVLDFHQPFAVRLINGSIVFSNKRIKIKDGVAYMRSNNLTAFVQT
jgi:F0F1-type ATP synthase epsilon subunit